MIKKIFSVCFCFITLGVLVVPALCDVSPTETTSIPMKAILTSVTGDVQIKRNEEIKWIKAKEQDLVFSGDAVKTTELSGVELKIMDGDIPRGNVLLKEKSELLVASILSKQVSQHTMLDVLMGEIVVKAQKLNQESSFEVRTPTSVIGIRGTEFSVVVKYKD